MITTRRVSIFVCAVAVCLLLASTASADLVKTLTVTGILGQWYENSNPNDVIPRDLNNNGIPDGGWTADPFDGKIPVGSEYSMSLLMNASNEITRVDYDLNGYDFSFTLPGATVQQEDQYANGVFTGWYDSYGASLIRFASGNTNLIDENLSGLPLNPANVYQLNNSNPLELSGSYVTIRSDQGQLPLDAWLNSTTPVSSIDILDPDYIRLGYDQFRYMKLDFTFNNAFLSIDGNVTGATFTSVSDSAAPVPEPATMLLFGTGLVGLVGVARRKKK